MSFGGGIKGKVGPWAIEFKSIPRGPSGIAHLEIKKADDVQAKPKAVEVRWRRDKDGLWIETPRGVFGFDVQGEAGDDAKVRYQFSQRGSDQAWEGLSFVRSGEESAAAAAGAVKKGTRVRAQMPGKIIRVIVAAGAVVEKDQPLLVMEAMKMENEIRAPQAGKIGQVKVAEGQAVETGADLCVIDPV